MARHSVLFPTYPLLEASAVPLSRPILLIRGGFGRLSISCHFSQTTIIK